MANNNIERLFVEILNGFYEHCIKMLTKSFKKKFEANRQIDKGCE